MANDKHHGGRTSHNWQLGVLLSGLLLYPLGTLARDIVVGYPAPDFHARTFDGHEVTLADFKGRVLVINLWATWCGPCRRELPLLDAFYRLRKNTGLDVIAVATEDSVSTSQLKPVAAAVSLPFICTVHGPYAAMGGVPTNFVIDRNGIVRYARAAAFDLDELNATLIPLLREKTATSPTQPQILER